MLTRTTAAVLLASLFWATVAAAQAIPQLEPPPLVRLTCALLPLADKGRSSLTTLTVLIAGKRWLLRVAKVEKLTGRNPNGWRLLQDLFPPQLRFVGPAALLSSLQDPEIAGKALIIEGRLYVGDRMLLITTVEEVAEKHERPAGVL